MADNAEAKLHGIHAEICGRLDGEWLRCNPATLQVALDFRDQHHRGRSAVSVIREIWRSFNGLGAAPAIDLLFDHEENFSAFPRGKQTHSGHRDHVVHTLELYLLGLDLLKGLPTLRKVLADHVGDEESLRKSWAIAALGHDPGYVFEVQDMARTPQYVQTLLADPLIDFNEMLSEAEISGIDYHYHSSLVSPESLETYRALNFFDWVEPEVQRTNLGPLREYHQFARKHGRHQYDHGIMSAMLLFQSYFRLRRRLDEDVTPFLDRLHLRPDQIGFLKDLAATLPGTEHALRAACGAIALHNIDKSYWCDKSDQRKDEFDLAKKRGLHLDIFELSLEKAPLAWFLGFCDTFQYWNRHKASGKDHGEGILLDPGKLSLRYEKDQAILAFADEESELRETAQNPFYRLRKRMVDWNWLSFGDVDRFLAKGTFIRDSTPEDRGPVNSAPSTVGLSRNVKLWDQPITPTNVGGIASQLKKTHRAAREHPDKKPVFVLYTGGSVGMVPEDSQDPSSPLRTSDDLSRVLRYLGRLGELSFDADFFRTARILDSSNMRPKDWIEIAKIIQGVYEHYMGFVILHGTDTMTFTASALSFMFQNLAKPVILTGAERPISYIGSDAESNIMRSLQVAALTSPDGGAEVPEVCIFFGNRLMRGNRAKKVKSLAFDGFDSPNCPYLGIVEDKIDIRKRIVRRSVGTPDEPLEIDVSLDFEVAIVELYPSSSACIETLKHQLQRHDVRGIVLKTYGTGNAPTSDDFIEPIREAVRAIGTQKVIVNVTSCPEGKVEVRLFEANARLFEAGVINGGDMTVEAAYTKLLWLLGKNLRRKAKDEDKYLAIKRGVQEDRRGELRLSAYELAYSGDVETSSGSPFIGAGKIIGPFDGRIYSALISINDVQVHTTERVPITLRLFYNNDDLDDSNLRGFIDNIVRTWTGQPDSRLTCNLEATKAFKNFKKDKEPISLQVGTDSKSRITIGSVVLTIFTDTNDRESPE